MTSSKIWPSRLTRLALALSVSALVACKDSNGASSPDTTPSAPAQEITLAQAGSQAPALAQADPAVASLGDIDVRRSEVEALLASLAPAQLEQLTQNRAGLEQWLRERLAEKALYQQALTQNWDKEPRIRQGLEMAKQQLVVQSYLASVSQAPAAYPSQDELKQAFEQNKSALQVPAQYRIEQIFFPASGQAEQDKQMQDLAQETSQQAKQSKNGLKTVGAELEKRSQGVVTRTETPLVPLSQLLPEVRSSLAGLKQGQTSELVRSQAGWHLLNVLETKPARPATFEEVEPELKRVLREQRQQEIAMSYLNGMLDTGTVSINGAQLRDLLDKPAPQASEKPATKP